MIFVARLASLGAVSKNVPSCLLGAIEHYVQMCMVIVCVVCESYVKSDRM